MNNTAEPEATTDPAAVRINAHGVPTVGATRVTLDSIVAAYAAGRPAEQIRKSFPTLTAADVFGALHYYLTHRAAVDEGIRRRAADAERLRAESIARGDHARLRGGRQAPQPAERRAEVAHAATAD